MTDPQLPRPYIPLGTRLVVARRQLLTKNPLLDEHFEMLLRTGYSTAFALSRALVLLFNGQKPHLDHDPALVLREFDAATGEYNPPANDEQCLVYRTVNDHRIKTHVGNGAQLSDTSQRMKARRMAENRGLRQRKPKKKIAARKNGWPPKGSRKLNWRKQAEDAVSARKHPPGRDR